MERLRIWLEGNGTTQGEFAKRMKVSQATVSDWINGKTSPTVDNLREIVDHTGIPVAELLDIPDPKRRTAPRAAA